MGDQSAQTESKPQLVEQIELRLRVGDYTHALDLLRCAAATFPDNAELKGLEKLAQDGLQRKADADRLITESQELFAQQKSAKAIQLLREAYRLDKRNSLARAILANALVEHAHSIVETDWLEAEVLTKQALDLNPAHPTAKTIQNRIVEQKKNSSVEDWIVQAQKLQSSGDLFGALAWVAEGLAVHPDDPKLLGIQNTIQRDQSARRRQARRGDLEDLQRMQLEIAGADVAAKPALAERIQAVAAKYWTDGEVLSLANRLLHQLGLVSEARSTASPHSKSATVIFHVPRASSPESSRLEAAQAPASVASPSPVATVPDAHPANVVTDAVLPSKIPSSKVPASGLPPGKVATTIPSTSTVGLSAVPTTAPEPELARSQAGTPSAMASAVPIKTASSSSQSQATTKSNSITLVVISVAAILLVAATFFFTRRHYATPVAKTSLATTSTSPTNISAPTVAAGAVFPPDSAATSTAEPSVPTLPVPSETAPGKVTLDKQSPDVPPRDLGSLLVIAGQDGASVFLNGKLQPQLTQARQLRLPNLELKDYVVEVSKSGFQDPPPQQIHIRRDQQATLVFNLQPQPRLASLTIQGGAPGTAVFVDQTLAGTIQGDGTLSVPSVTPGNHTVELRKEKFKPREFTKHFVAGGAISLLGADAALEPAAGELKITFAPADAKVALVKGDLLTMVSSGVPLNLAAGTYTLTARTADGFTRSSTLQVIAGQTGTLDLPLAPTGMSNWNDPGAWKQEKECLIRKGGDFVLYGVPASGTFVFSAMATKGHLLQWVVNYIDPQNYVLFQMDENYFYRSVIRNGQKADQVRVPDKGDKKNFRTLHIRVSATEIVEQIRHGDRWTVLDHWTQPGADLSAGKFGFYIPGDDEVAVSSFAHYPDLNIR